MVKVWPVAVSMLNWPTFIKEVASLTGHAPTNSLDSCGIKFSEHARQIISLTEFYREIATPSTVLQQSDQALGHLSFSFLILAPVSDLLSFVANSQLEILLSETKKKNYRLAFVSGHLGKWKQSLVKESMIGSICLDFFIKIGLKQVFAADRKLIR